MELLSCTVLLALGCAALGWALRRGRGRGPPCVRGWLPWVGAGTQLGRAPLDFIQRARAQCGPVFTVFAMGTRMTFVTEEEGINVFLNSKHVNFELAVQKPVYRTASVPKNIFFTLHEKLYIVMKGKLGTFNIHQFTGKLMQELHEQLEKLGSRGTMDLNNLVRDLLYPATVNILFDKGLIPTNKGELQQFYRHFETYDEGFEYGSQLPEWLLRNWSKSKKWLLATIEKNITHMKACKSAKDNSMTVMQAILDVVEMETREQSPNYGLLMLWASLSNAVTTAFWTLAFVLSHPDVHRALREDIASVFGSAGKDKMKVTEDELKKLPLIKWCVLEAIRLRAPGVIARKVVKPVKIMNFTIPAGDLLVVSPFWLHRNPKHFPEPELFKPERWKMANLEKHAFLDGFIAFGGGKFQCPGRWFALLQIEICIILMLYKYDCCLLDPLPKQSDLHLVGVPKPEGQCRIEYKERA
ncbi:24-hydroxycholesterol 7-alpha-hydroxylase [Perognathus longimembris pacificus]|uniref:24-hydroxycholesterol 7-alpha-hydroxylase n=1 Tax=Perognathus longimembris pacificus TaxID=214514 RepID=UPI00201A166B|nr:24-hydroxycholesterol 7-alpha-hydroxylase [Perognathus longimembris pacificus]